MAIINKCPTPISCYKWIKEMKERHRQSGTDMTGQQELDALCIDEISKLTLSNGRFFGLPCAKLFYEYLGFDEILN